jgi:hypothetical protein
LGAFYVKKVKKINAKVYQIAFQFGSKINPSMMKGFQNARKGISGTNKALASTKQYSSSAKSALGGLSSAFKAAAGAALAYFGINAIKNFAGESVTAAKAQIEAETKLKTILVQRTKATDAQVQAVLKLTAAQQNIGVVGDEVQIAGLQQLGTFVNQTKSLEVLTPAMNNLLVQQKGLNGTQEDAVNIGNLMGKVMGGQVGALKRVGITFSAAQEKVLKFGTEQEKAAMLAKVITDNVGEMNKAMAKTDQGKIQKTTNAWGDMKEEIGKKVLPIQAKFASFMFKILPNVQSVFLGVVDKISGGIDKVSQGFKTISPYISKLIGKVKELQPAFNSIKQYIMPIINTIKGALGNIFKGNSDIFGTIITQVKNTVNVLKPPLTKVAQVFKNTFIKVAPVIVGFVTNVQGAMAKIIPVFFTAFNYIAQKILPLLSNAFSFIATTVLPTVIGAFNSWLPRIVSIVQNLWAIIQPIIGAVVAVISFAFPFIKNIIMTQINYISTIIGGLLRVLDGIITFISGVFTGNWSKAWQGVRDIFGGIFDTLGAIIKKPINNVIAIINGAFSNLSAISIKVPDWVPGLGGKQFGFHLPQIPMLANGGYVKHRPGGVLANIGEGRHDEVVAPLPKLQSFVNSALMRNTISNDTQQSIPQHSQILTSIENTLRGILQKIMSQQQIIKPVTNLSIPSNDTQQSIDVSTKLQDLLNSSAKTTTTSTSNTEQPIQITYSPQIIIQGNADKAVIEEANQKGYEDFKSKYEALQNRNQRLSFARR